MALPWSTWKGGLDRMFVWPTMPLTCWDNGATRDGCSKKDLQIKNIVTFVWTQKAAKTCTIWYSTYYGGVSFYSIHYSINLNGTCLKILSDPTYIQVEAGTLLPVTLSPCVSLSLHLLMPHHGNGSRWLIQVPPPKWRQIQAQRPHLKVLGNVPYTWIGWIPAGGWVVLY